MRKSMLISAAFCVSMTVLDASLAISAQDKYSVFSARRALIL